MKSFLRSRELVDFQHLFRLALQKYRDELMMRITQGINITSIEQYRELVGRFIAFNDCDKLIDRVNEELSKDFE